MKTPSTNIILLSIILIIASFSVSAASYSEGTTYAYTTQAQTIAFGVVVQITCGNCSAMDLVSIDSVTVASGVTATNILLFSDGGTLLKNATLVNNTALLNHTLGTFQDVTGDKFRIAYTSNGASYNSAFNDTATWPQNHTVSSETGRCYGNSFNDCSNSDSGIYRYGVIQYVVGVNAGSASFLDDAETGSITDKWSLVAGQAAYSTTQAHTGSRSIQINQTGNGVARIRTTLGDLMNKSFDVWFYDDANATPNIYQYIWIGEFGVDGSFALGWDQIFGDGNSYEFIPPGTTNQDSNISRTVGWHRLTVQTFYGNVSFALDGTVFYNNKTSSTLVQSIDQTVEILTSVNDGGTYQAYWDDVNISDSPANFETATIPPTIQSTNITTLNTTIPYNGSRQILGYINITDTDSATVNITYSLRKDGVHYVGGTVNGFSTLGVTSNYFNYSVNVTGNYSVQVNVTDATNTTQATSNTLEMFYGTAPVIPLVPPIINTISITTSNITIPYAGSRILQFNLNVTDTDNATISQSTALIRSGATVYSTSGLVSADAVLRNYANTSVTVPGNYTLQLNVTDGINRTSATSANLEIFIAPAPPTPPAPSDPVPAVIGVLVAMMMIIFLAGWAAVRFDLESMKWVIAVAMIVILITIIGLMVAL